MKRSILLGLAMFLIGTAIQANNKVQFNETFSPINYYDDVVTFIEKGIVFHVYLNGDFDFRELNRNSRYFNNYRNGRIRISRNYEGRINRVGRVSISYDYNGNVRRIGHVRMKYRYNQLVRVGQLRISYNYGRPEFYGYVNYNDYDYDYYDSGFNVSIHLGSIFDYNHHFFYGRDFRNNYRKFREDRNYYYYKSHAKNGKGKIIKRRKSSKRDATTRNSTKRDSKYNKAESNRNSGKKSNSRRKYDYKKSSKSTKSNKPRKVYKKRKVEKKQPEKRKVETTRSKRRG